MDSKNTRMESKIKFWQKNSQENMLIHEIIKLSTVNVSGIYLPPSPSDESNSPTKDYFEARENFYVPSSDKLCYKRQLYTPSQFI